jgi:hypothetical protein
VVLANSEQVQPDLIGAFYLFDQVLQALRWVERQVGLIKRCCKAINPNLNL